MESRGGLEGFAEGGRERARRERGEQWKREREEEEEEEEKNQSRGQEATERRENTRGMPWIKCLGGGGGKARRGKPLSVSQPIHLLVKV